MDTGLYIVTLNNDEPISVNADRPSIADRCIKVNRENCKVGRAKSFEARRKEYYRTFGKENVNFTPVIAVEDFQRAEKAILPKLDIYRMRGPTGRKNEWLSGIEPVQVLKIVISTLEEEGIPHRAFIRPVDRSGENRRPKVAQTPLGVRQPSGATARAKTIINNPAVKRTGKKYIRKALRSLWREIAK